MRASHPLVVINASAARVRDDPGLIEAIGAAAGDRAEVVVTRSQADLDGAADGFAARALRDGGRRWAPWILVGGDGSHMAGVTALAARLGGRDLPPVALVAAGTFSTVARALGSRGDAARDVRAALLPGRTLAHATLSVTDEGGARRVGFIWGAGLVARFFEQYDASGRGLGAAAFLAARLVAGAALGRPFARRILDPGPLTLELDGERISGELFSLAVASVVPSVGLGVRVAYRALDDPARLHFVASRAGAARLVRLAPRTLLGAPLGEGTVDRLVGEARVGFAGPGGPYVLDGETLRAREVQIRPGPRLSLVRLGAESRCGKGPWDLLRNGSR